MNQFLLLLSFLFPFMVFWIPRHIKKQGLLSVLLRRTIVVLPYTLWLNVLDRQKIQWNFTWLIWMFLTVILLIWWEREEYFFKASSLYAQLTGVLSITDFLVNIYNLTIFIAAEEIFFRLGVLSIFSSKWAVVVQAVAFVLAHYATPWGISLTWKDLTRQFVFAVVAGFYFMETHDLIICIASHALLNMPEFIHLSRRLILKQAKEEAFYGSF